MTTKKGTQKKGERAKVDAATERQIAEFARHFSEVLKIAKDAPFITTRLYNDLADAWCEYENSVQRTGNLHDTPEMMTLFLRQAVKEGAREYGEKGGE
jgi:hypothetical protein